MLTLAISKGRILQKTLPLLEKVQIFPSEDLQKTRNLIVGTNLTNLRLLILRSVDVTTYVGSGAVEIGIVGKDMIMEYSEDNVYEPIDLNIARCKLVLAAKTEQDLQKRPLRVATKYPLTARKYLATTGRQIEIIKLYGSMEVAPTLGLADCIVDLVDTGNTLKANGLQPLKTICSISSRIIVNKGAMKVHDKSIRSLLEKISLCLIS